MEHDLTIRLESQRKLKAIGYVLRGSFHTDTYLLDLIVQVAERLARLEEKYETADDAL